MTIVPSHLYDLKDSLMHGVIRACDYLMWLRVEELVKTPDGELGLRRATHVVPLIEVMYLSHQTSFGTGLFRKELKDEVDHRLVTARLGPQEQHFRDIGWWQSLNRTEARQELRSNLERLIADAPTTCLVIGVELQVLFDIRMHEQYADEYTSVITPELVTRSETLFEAMTLFHRLLKPASAAA